jgi:hypothetical protein
MVDFETTEVNLGVLKEHFGNIEYPFTELLSLLKLYKSTQNGSSKMVYSPKALQAMDKHADNAIQSLLFGMQSLGHTLGVVNNETGNEIATHTSNLGFLIQSISNLIEALHQLRTDIRNNYSDNAF